MDEEVKAIGVIVLTQKEGGPIDATAHFCQGKKISETELYRVLEQIKRMVGDD